MEKKQQKMIPTPSPVNIGYKVLVGTPTSESKNYCLSEFLAKIKNLSYKNYDILIADNSANRKNYKRLIKEDKVDCIYVKPKQKPIQLVLAETHEAIRDYFLRGDYDYLLHLESDMMPCQDLIERLMIHNKPIVSACYFINDAEPHLMIQQLEKFGDTRDVANIKDGADLNMMDGKLHEVFACGLGAILIRRDVLEQIAFRWESPAIVFPDSFFHYDANSLNISRYVDTSILLNHKNSSWTTEFSRFEK